MFDVDVGGVSYRESEHEAAGSEIVTARVGELDAGPHRLLRPPLPGALPDPRPARRPARRRPLRLHRSPPAATTGRCCCGRGRSRTRSSSSPPTRSARRRPTTLLRPLGDRRPLGGRAGDRPRRGVLHRRRPRLRRAGARARVAALARQPPGPRPIAGPGSDRRPRLAVSPDGPGTAGRQTPPHPRRRHPRLRPPGLPLDPRLRHRRRGRGRLRARLPLLQLQGRGARTSCSSSAGRCCWRRSRRPTGGGEPALEARRGGRLHRRLLPPRPGADEGDHRRGDAGGELVRPHPPRGDPPRLRLDREDRRRGPGGGRLPPRHRPDVRLDVLLRSDRAAALRLDLRGDPGLRPGLRTGQGRWSSRRSATASSRDR